MLSFPDISPADQCQILLARSQAYTALSRPGEALSGLERASQLCARPKERAFIAQMQREPARARRSMTEDHMFKKILIANRSEIAVRAIRRLPRDGRSSPSRSTSDADRESRHVAMADEAVCIGPGPSKLSYLNQENVLSAAKITGAEAIHPGYGFLSENADFSELCAKRGFVFIGPPPAASRKLGFKSAGKAVALSRRTCSRRAGHEGRCRDRQRHH